MLDLIRRLKLAGWRIPIVSLLVVGIAVIAALTTSLKFTSQEPITRTHEDIAFLGTFDGRPTAWDACQPIGWQLNSGGVPEQVVNAVHEAIATIAAASGFDFVFLGDTDSTHPQGMRSDPPAVDIHVEIVPDAHSDILAMGEWGVTDLRRAGGVINGAVVALNADGDGFHTLGPGEGSWHSLVLHEFGHVLGLAHSSNPNDLMQVEWSETAGVLSAQDRQGLQILRNQSECE